MAENEAKNRGSRTERKSSAERHRTREGGTLARRGPSPLAHYTFARDCALLFPCCRAAFSLHSASTFARHSRF
jgi:hypothetical protein